MAAEQKDWRSKYYNTLDELEAAEQQAGKLTGALRLSLNRLSLAAEGRHPALDPLLHKLRDYARRSNELGTIEQLLEQVAEVLKSQPRADNNTSPAPTDTGPTDTASRDLLIELADSHDRRHGKTPQSMELRRRIGRARDPLSMLSLARELGVLLLDTVNPSDANAAVNDPPPARPAREAAPARPVIETRGALHAHELFIRLLEKLDLPADLQDAADAIKQRLGKEPTDTDWPPLLKDTVSLVTRLRTALQKEQKAMEQFLAGLMEKLNEIDKGLLETQQAGRDAHEQGGQLQQSVAARLLDMQQDLSSAADLQTLKQSVQIQLDHINSHLNRYKEGEKDRQARLSQQMEFMQQQLRDMKSMAAELQKNLAEARARSHQDALTGMANRMAYDERLEQEVARWRRYHSPLSLVIMDIDHFKRINDSYGHKAGDKTLALVAQLLKKSMRESDFIARYGGEEFVALLPGTDADNALIAAEKIRKTVEAAVFHNRGERVPITVSCGVTGLREGDSAESAFERADQAVYAAKHEGRNRVIGR